jgi:hypothetical protein
VTDGTITNDSPLQGVNVPSVTWFLSQGVNVPSVTWFLSLGFVRLSLGFQGECPGRLVHFDQWWSIYDPNLAGPRVEYDRRLCQRLCRCRLRECL